MEVVSQNHGHGPARDVLFLGQTCVDANRVALRGPRQVPISASHPPSTGNSNSFVERRLFEECLLAPKEWPDVLRHSCIRCGRKHPPRCGVKNGIIIRPHIFNQNTEWIPWTPSYEGLTNNPPSCPKRCLGLWFCPESRTMMSLKHSQLALYAMWIDGMCHCAQQNMKFVVHPSHRTQRLELIRFEPRNTVGRFFVPSFEHIQLAISRRLNERLGHRGLQCWHCPDNEYSSQITTLSAPLRFWTPQRRTTGPHWSRFAFVLAVKFGDDIGSHIASYLPHHTWTVERFQSIMTSRHIWTEMQSDEQQITMDVMQFQISSWLHSDFASFDMGFAHAIVTTVDSEGEDVSEWVIPGTRDFGNYNAQGVEAIPISFGDSIDLHPDPHYRLEEEFIFEQFSNALKVAVEIPDIKPGGGHARRVATTRLAITDLRRGTVGPSSRGRGTLLTAGDIHRNPGPLPISWDEFEPQQDFDSDPNLQDELFHMRPAFQVLRFHHGTGQFTPAPRLRSSPTEHRALVAFIRWMGGTITACNWPLTHEIHVSPRFVFHSQLGWTHAACIHAPHQRHRSPGTFVVVDGQPAMIHNVTSFDWLKETGQQQEFLQAHLVWPMIRQSPIFECANQQLKEMNLPLLDNDQLEVAAARLNQLGHQYTADELPEHLNRYPGDCDYVDVLCAIAFVHRMAEDNSLQITATTLQDIAVVTTRPTQNGARSNLIFCSRRIPFPARKPLTLLESAAIPDVRGDRFDLHLRANRWVLCASRVIPATDGKMVTEYVPASDTIPVRSSAPPALAPDGHQPIRAPVPPLAVALPPVSVVTPPPIAIPVSPVPVAIVQPPPAQQPPSPRGLPAAAARASAQSLQVVVTLPPVFAVAPPVTVAPAALAPVVITQPPPVAQSHPPPGISVPAPQVLVPATLPIDFLTLPPPPVAPAVIPFLPVLLLGSLAIAPLPPRTPVAPTIVDELQLEGFENVRVNMPLGSRSTFPPLFVFEQIRFPPAIPRPLHELSRVDQSWMERQARECLGGHYGRFLPQQPPQWWRIDAITHCGWVHRTLAAFNIAWLQGAPLSILAAMIKGVAPFRESAMNVELALDGREAWVGINDVKFCRPQQKEFHLGVSIDTTTSPPHMATIAYGYCNILAPILSESQNIVILTAPVPPPFDTPHVFRIKKRDTTMIERVRLNGGDVTKWNMLRAMQVRDFVPGWHTQVQSHTLEIACSDQQILKWFGGSFAESMFPALAQTVKQSEMRGASTREPMRPIQSTITHDSRFTLRNPVDISLYDPLIRHHAPHIHDAAVIMTALRDIQAAIRKANMPLPSTDQMSAIVAALEQDAQVFRLPESGATTRFSASIVWQRFPDCDVHGRCLLCGVGFSGRRHDCPHKRCPLCLQQRRLLIKGERVWMCSNCSVRGQQMILAWNLGYRHTPNLYVATTELPSFSLFRYRATKTDAIDSQPKRYGRGPRCALSITDFQHDMFDQSPHLCSFAFRTVPFVSARDSNSVASALLCRVLSPITVPQRKVAQELLPPDMFGLTVPTFDHPTTWVEWVSTFPWPRRRQLQRIRDILFTFDFNDSRLYRRNLVIKQELLLKDVTEGYAPRAVLGLVNLAPQVLLGPYMRRVGQLLKHHWGLTHPVVYASGRTAEELGDIITAFQSTGHVWFADGDYTKFDRSINVELLRVERQFYARMGVRDSRVFQCLRRQEQIRGSYKHHGQVVATFSSEGGRASGDSNTSCGNSIINGLVAACAARALSLSWRFAVCGDDLLIGSPLPVTDVECTLFVQFVSRFGLTLQLFPRPSPAHIHFVGGWPITAYADAVERFVFVPETHRFLGKHGWSLEWQSQPDSWIRGVAMAWRILANCHPLMSPIVAKELELTEGSRVKPLKDSERPQILLHPTRTTFRMHPLGVKQFCSRHAVSFDELASLTKQIQSVQSFPVLIEHPVLDRLLRLE